MRIAVFTDTYFPQVNGVSQYLHEMRKYMDNNNIDYQFFVPDKHEGMETNNLTSFYGMPFLIYPELRISLPSHSRVKRAMDKFRPDIIYLATPLSIGIAGLRYAKRNGIPIVATYHTNIPQYLSYYHLDSLQRVIWKYLQWFHFSSRINFCPSMETLAQLKKHEIGNLILCNNGIDCTSFSPELRSEKLRNLFAPEGQALLLYVGRVAPEKNLDVLIGAARLLNNMQVDFKLLVVGDGPSLKSLQEQGLQNVIFTGYKTGRELQEIYASADVFVFPSCTETFGNVILEAMSSSLPVVAANAGGVKESLRDGLNGFTFAPGDEKEMADCIIKLLDDNELRKNMAEAARSFALARTWDKIFSRFFDNCLKINSEYQQSTEAHDKIA